MRLQHIVDLRRIALQIAIQLPVDPHDAKAVVGFLGELVTWSGEIPITRIDDRRMVGGQS